MAEPLPDGSDGPLATIAAARDRLRQIKREQGLFGGATVWIRGGRYRLDAPLVFTPEDSGTRIYAPGSKRKGLDHMRRPHDPLFYLDAGVTYAAYGDETVIIDGGQTISGWRHEQVNGCTAWVADLPEVREGRWTFRQLFVNGERRGRPRLPKQGFFWIEDVPGLVLPAAWGMSGQTAFVCCAGDMQAWRNIEDVEVVVIHFWIEERFPVASFDPASRLVRLGRLSRAPLSDDYQSRYAKYYIENVFEALKEPGESYLDRPAGRLYYLPMPGERPDNTEVSAPRLLQLMVLEGSPEEGAFVEGLRFEGLEFCNTDWRHPGEEDTPAVRQACYAQGKCICGANLRLLHRLRATCRVSSPCGERADARWSIVALPMAVGMARNWARVARISRLSATNSSIWEPAASKSTALIGLIRPS